MCSTHGSSYLNIADSYESFIIICAVTDPSKYKGVNKIVFIFLSDDISKYLFLNVLWCKIHWNLFQKDPLPINQNLFNYDLVHWFTDVSQDGVKKIYLSIFKCWIRLEHTMWDITETCIKTRPWSETFRNVYLMHASYKWNHYGL